MNQQQLIPTARTAEILADVFGCASFSEGTLGTAVEECYPGLEGVERAVQAGVRQAAVAHFDETGLNIGGRLHWLHVARTPHLTHYTWHQKRGAEAADEIGILPEFTGTGVHDGLASYWRYGWTHALCHAHHLRELTFIEERLGQAWAREMKTLLGEIKQAVDAARSGGAAHLPADIQHAFVVRYRSIRPAGSEANPPPERPAGQRGRPKRGKVLSLLDRLSDHEEPTLAFLRDFAVPFDNNQAERDLRMVKVPQIGSGCFRQPQGAARFCRIRGYRSTAREQGQRTLSCIEGVLRGHPFLPDVLSGVAGG